MVTAKSGLNVSGGEVAVGSALTISGVGVATFIGAAGVAVTITPSTGKVQATTFEGPLTGNVTGDLTGTVNTAAQTSITSVGTLAGLTVGSAGEFKVGTGVTIASTSGVSTFAEDTHFIGAGAKNIQWDKSAGQLDVLDNTKIKFGSGGDLSIFHDGSDNYISGDVDGMDLFIRSRKDVTISCGNNASGYHSVLYADNNGSTRLYHPDTDAIKLQTTNDGISITGMSTVTTGAHFQGMLREDCNIVANKLSAGTNIDLEDGMVHYYSTNETTTATPNIRWNSSYALNNKMSTGESVTVTIISKPNGAGYYTHLTVDGSAVTEYWNGGNTPSSANAGGFDVTTYQITKIGSGSFLVLSLIHI